MLKINYLLFLLLMTIVSFSGIAKEHEIFSLIQDNHESSVKRLIEKDLSVVNVKDKDGDTPLMYAVRAGHLAMVKRLVEKGAAINAENKRGLTALMEAISTENNDIVKYLLKKGARYNEKDSSGRSVLDVVESRGNKKLEKVLQKQKSKDEKQANKVIELIRKGKVGAVMEMIRQDPEVVVLRDEAGSTLLMHAVQSGQEELVNFFIENGANINAKNTKGVTPLMFAAKKGTQSEAMVALLLAKGASYREKDHLGKTAFDLALEKRNKRVANLLRRHRGISEKLIFELIKDDDREGINQLIAIDPSVLALKDTAGNSTLVYAVLSNNMELVKRLELDVNTKNSKGVTPLMYAAMDPERTQILSYLLAKGANYNEKDSDGRTAFDIASARGNVLGVELLKHHKGVTEKLIFDLIRDDDNEGVSELIESDPSIIHQRDEHGDTVLMYAVRANNLNLVKAMIKKGARYDEKNLEGKIALDFGNILIRDYLLKHKINKERLIFDLLKADDLDGVHQLIKKNRAVVDYKDRSGDSTLVYAILGHHLDLVRELVEQNASNVNSKNNQGITPLMHASMGKDNEEIVRYLLSQGANYNEKDRAGRTAFDIASANGNVELSTILKRHKCIEEKLIFDLLQDDDLEGGGQLISKDPSVMMSIDKEGDTLLTYAILGHHFYLVKKLIGAGIKVNTQNRMGITPLMYAAATDADTDENGIQIMNYLLDEGADYSVKDSVGRTALDFAIGTGNSVKAKILKHHKGIGEQLIFDLIREGDQDGIDQLMKRDSSLRIFKKKDNSGNTTLMHAIKANNFPLVKILFENGESINAQNKQRETPLMVAAATKEVKGEIIDYLLSHGAKDEDKNRAGQTALDIAKAIKNSAALDSLLKYKTDKEKVIFDLIQNDDLVGVHQLLEKNPSAIYYKDQSGDTTIVYAILGNHLDFVQELVAKGLEVNSKNNLGITPLMYAVMDADNIEIVQYLLSQGASYKEKDSAGRTAFDLATGKGNALMAKLLKRHKAVTEKLIFELINDGDSEGIAQLMAKDPAIIHAVDNNDNTVLMHAILKKNFSLAEILLQKGLDINEEDAKGMTPLMLVVAANGSYEMIDYLLQHGAHYDEKNNSGQTAFDIAKSKKNSVIFDQLLKYKTNKERVVFDLIRKNDLVGVQQLLEKDPKVLYYKDQSGDSTLVYAILGNHIDLLEKFLTISKGSLALDINGKNNQGITPLMHASMDKDNIAIINYLLAHGANYNEKDGAGRTAYDIASKNGNVVMAKLLKRHKGVTEKLIFELISDGDHEGVLQLIEKDASIVRAIDPQGNTTLMRAVLANNLPLVKTLLQKGLDINGKNKDEMTPLMLAASGGKDFREMIDYLLKQGAHYDEKNSSGQTAFDLAKTHGQSAVFEQMLQFKTNKEKVIFDLIQGNNLVGVQELLKTDKKAIHYKNPSGNSTLVYAVLGNHLDLIRSCLAAGVDINGKNNQGITPLMHACVGMDKELSKEGTDLVRYLLSQGANYNERDYSGRTAFDIASARGNGELATLLKRHRAVTEKLIFELIADGDNLGMAQLKAKDPAIVKALDHEGNTTLMHAIFKKDLDLVKELLRKGLDVNAKNNRGITPLMFAAKDKDCADIVDYLISEGAEVNEKDKSGNTALTFAEQAGNHAVAKLFREWESAYRTIFANAQFRVEGVYEKVPASGENGGIHTYFTNDLNHPVAIGLYHPSDMKLMRQEIVLPGRRQHLSAPYGLRSDFGVAMISPEHPLLRKMMSLGDCALRDSSEYSLKASDYITRVDHLLNHPDEITGMAPLHQAAFSEDPKKLEKLLQDGANPNQRNPFTLETPLHTAIRAFDADCVQALLNFGADPVLKNAGGCSAAELLRNVCAKVPSSLAYKKDEVESVFKIGQFYELLRMGNFKQAKQFLIDLSKGNVRRNGVGVEDRFVMINRNNGVLSAHASDTRSLGVVRKDNQIYLLDSNRGISIIPTHGGKPKEQISLTFTFGERAPGDSGELNIRDTKGPGNKTYQIPLPCKFKGGSGVSELDEIKKQFAGNKKIIEIYTRALKQAVSNGNLKAFLMNYMILNISQEEDENDLFLSAVVLASLGYENAAKARLLNSATSLGSNDEKYLQLYSVLMFADGNKKREVLLALLKSQGFNISKL
ncbi:MAG: ankyrin repeat domain-containing protein [Oligoflexia bacterium]|nr:ankyrin repeat domain-containing protein [Oligoflexia bacterium]